MSKSIAISVGEPAGIGPDLVVQLAAQGQLDNCLIFADHNVLEQRAKQLGIELNCNIEHIPAPTPVITGKPDPGNSSYVISALKQATDAVLNGQCSHLVTGPINKAVINQAGIPFSGHTEWLRDYTKTKRVVMLLANKNMRVVPLTRHVPIKEVANKLTPELIEESLTILAQGLQQYFSVTQPRIALCGLNPHAGEQGHIGREETEVMQPVIKKLQQQGMHVTGPVSADTAFTQENLANNDVIVTCFHDQGLPVIKSHGFGDIVNITLGLPFLRTSVDHGTALELAGTGKADPSSLKAAIEVVSHES